MPGSQKYRRLVLATSAIASGLAGGTDLSISTLWTEVEAVDVHEKADDASKTVPPTSRMHQGTRSVSIQCAKSETTGAPGIGYPSCASVVGLRVEFERSCDLGTRGALTITATDECRDGSCTSQRLDQQELARRYYSSAFFNGTGVIVEFDEVPAGECQIDKVAWQTVDPASLRIPVESKQACGNDDDRKLPQNHDKAIGRLKPVSASIDPSKDYCTAWIAKSGMLVSAGHCYPKDKHAEFIVEFNVPPSLPNGIPQNSNPKDQYPFRWEEQSLWLNDKGECAAPARDWMVFKIKPIQGLTPLERQQSCYEPRADLKPSTVRLTGYGRYSADGTRNFAQQTNSGSLTQNGNLQCNGCSNPSMVKYVVDVDKGNSGSPVIALGSNDENLGVALGVHTCGACWGSHHNWGVSFRDTSVAGNKTLFQAVGGNPNVDVSCIGNHGENH